MTWRAISGRPCLKVAETLARNAALAANVLAATAAKHAFNVREIAAALRVSNAAKVGRCT